MSAVPKQRIEDPVALAAQEAMKEGGGDVQKASRLLEAAVRKNRDLRDALTDPLLANACYDAVRKVCIVERRAIWKPPVEKRVASIVTGAKRVVQLAAGNLLTFPLPGGKKLGEATRAEISKAAEFYRSQSADMQSKAKWLQLVAQSIPEDKTAGDVLTDKRLRELQKEAQK